MRFLNIAAGALTPTRSTVCLDQGVCGMSWRLNMTYMEVIVLGGMVSESAIYLQK